MTPDPGWEFLLTEAGRHLVHDTTIRHTSGESLETLGKSLRKAGHDGSVVAATLTQVGLRSKARSKFGQIADHLWFTQAGLEQASRNLVAREHATRFLDAGISRVADLGCGIGAESLAFLAAGLTVRAVELDPFTARLAEYNLAAVSESSRFTVLTGEATVLGPGNAEGVFLDPARRTPGHRETTRLTSPNDYSPPLTFAFDLARSLPIGIKLGPGFERELIPNDVEAQWVSVGGNLVETSLWSRETRREGVTRSALLLTERGGEVTRHEMTADHDATDAPVGEIEQYLYEPDGAVIRARLIGQLAENLGAHMLDPHIAYMTSARHTPTPFAQTFRVIEEVSVKPKALQRVLAAHEVGTLEIKKRGVDVRPEDLRKKLKLRGDRAATLILARIGSAHRAWLCARMPAA